MLNNSKLEELKISNRNMNQHLSDSDAVFLFSNLKTTLKSVAFDMSGLTEIAYTVIFQFISIINNIFVENTSKEIVG